jgi:hypothetical protein
MEAVRIKTDGTVKNGHRTVHIKKKLGEAVLFIAQGQGGPWKVVFDKPEGNPFTPSSINVPQGSFKSSGSPRSDAELRSYRYTVYDDNGNPKDDPDVDVE